MPTEESKPRANVCGNANPLKKVLGANIKGTKVIIINIHIILRCSPLNEKVNFKTLSIKFYSSFHVASMPIFLAAPAQFLTDTATVTLDGKCQ